jgi:hypothetical protein
MNGPRPICAGCGELTSVGKPVCDECAGLLGEIGHMYCALCEGASGRDAPILPANPQGIHYVRGGGYAGRCTAVKVKASWSSEIF